MLKTEDETMKQISLLLWVTQFGFSILFPVCFFLVAGTWLQDRFDLGPWILVVCGVIGLLTSVSTTRSCIRAMRKEADAQKKESDQVPPVAFNDHD